MSYVNLKSWLGHYFSEVPESIIFTARLMQDQCYFTQSQVYFGQTIGEMKHSIYGIRFFSAPNKNMIIYEGTWEKNQPNGKGSKYTFSILENGKIYKKCSQGNWKDGKLHGMGKEKEYDLQKSQWITSFQGQFYEGSQQGQGIQYYGNNCYEGHFFEGLRSGDGRIISDNGNYYQGNFEKGFPKGRGIQKKGNNILTFDEDDTASVYEEPKIEKLPQFMPILLQQL